MNYDIKIIVFFIIVICVAVYIMIDNNKKAQIRMINKIKKSYGKRSSRKYSYDEFEMISHYYEDSIEDGIIDTDDFIDDITWNDLNMDAVFKDMNICNSSVGQEYLYRMLRVPCNDLNKLKETDRLASYFDNNEKQRLDVQKIFAELGFAKHISLSDYLGLIVDLKAGSNFIHYLSVILLAAALVFCLFINPVIGIALVIGAVAFSVISYYRFKAGVESYFGCVTQLVKMLRAAKAINDLKLEELKDYNEDLTDICSQFSNITKNSGLIVSGNVSGSFSEMILEYVRMLTHADLIKFNNMVKLLGKKQDVVFKLFDILGFIESCICVASYRNVLPYYSKPEFVNTSVSNSNARLTVKEAFHPLIEKPVANSINADKHVLLTGSNASGKSTFLKTIAINALLSQAIYTSVSKEYKASFFRIYSSMSLKDDLSSNNSYYIVEIKSLKRILDSTEKKDSKPVLCFVDEVLRGTNTVERIAASSEILKSLRYKNVLVFAATHDIELTALLEKYYDNYHFEEQVTDNDVKFNFKLFKGPATTRNAIKLLNVIGYDKEIIDNAERRANYFIEHGVWNC